MEDLHNKVSEQDVKLAKVELYLEKLTGDPDANKYVHPTYVGDDINLDTGATVISDLDFNVTTDTLGHVTDANATYSTRNLCILRR